MKPHIFIISALTLASCGGGTSQQEAGNAEQVNQTEQAYQYVEPQDSVAKIIWDKLKTNDPHISTIIATAVKLNYMPQSKAEKNVSKTSFDYTYEGPFIEGQGETLTAKFRLQCYQTLDSSWIAVVDETVLGDQIDSKEITQKIWTVKYKDGQVSATDAKQVFDNNFYSLETLRKRPEGRDTVVFENTALTFYSSRNWPIKYTWNGKNFDLDSKILFNNVNTYHGSFNNYYNLDLYNIIIGEHYDYLGDGVLKDPSGKILAKFDLVDGKVTGYTIVDSSCAVVQGFNGSYPGIRTEGFSNKPIALGFPIKNVLDYDCGQWKNMKDTAVTKGMKDGKYIITQQLKHSERNGIILDVFIDYVAKDENSLIESIKVYSKSEAN